MDFYVKINVTVNAREDLWLPFGGIADCYCNFTEGTQLKYIHFINGIVVSLSTEEFTQDNPLKIDQWSKYEIRPPREAKTFGFTCLFLSEQKRNEMVKRM